MNIFVNDKAQEVNTQANIGDLLTSLNLASQKGIAIAINNNVIPRTEWNTHTLREEDKVMLIRATQGG